MDEATRRWNMFIHLSLLSGYVIPYAGFFMPVVLWLIKRNELPATDFHGKLAVNWSLTFAIFGLFLGVMAFVGFFSNFLLLIMAIGLLIVLNLLGVIFPIIAALKAGQDVLWPYPLAIPFFKIS